jgi:hypothetical protein
MKWSRCILSITCRQRAALIHVSSEAANVTSFRRLVRVNASPRHYSALNALAQSCCTGCAQVQVKALREQNFDQKAVCHTGGALTLAEL